MKRCGRGEWKIKFPQIKFSAFLNCLCNGTNGNKWQQTVNGSGQKGAPPLMQHMQLLLQNRK